MTLPAPPSIVAFCSDFNVTLIDCMASDESVVRSAKVSTQGAASRVATAQEGLINFLMRNRHGTPFEHNSFTFYVSAPIFVFREFQRHRIASYNEESGRYKQLDPVFYVPPAHRPLVQVGKAGEYRFEPGSDLQHEVVESLLKQNSEMAYHHYRELLDRDGIAREVARMVLPLNIYSSMYVTMNARSLMNFLSLRVEEEGSTYPSFPQWEIEQVARQMEEIFMVKMPLTHLAFLRNGRVAP